MIPFKLKNDVKQFTLSLKKSPSHLVKNGGTKFLPKIGQESVTVPLKKEVAQGSPVRAKKLRTIKLVED